MSATAGAIAERIDAELLGDAAVEITDAQALDEAGAGHITFADGEKNLRKLAGSRASAAVIRRESTSQVHGGTHPPALLLVDDPQAAFTRVLTILRPRRTRPEIGVSPHAFVSPTARIGPQTNVHPGAHVGDDVEIGQGCEIHPHVVIGPGCRLGERVTLHPGVVLYHDVTVGDRVTIHASSVIGADGFGYRLVDGRREKIPHFGTVRIEDDVEIGACTTVDRAMIGETVIGAGTKLDNLVMIAHNCRIGRHNAFVAQVGLAGSVTTGDYVVCAGHVGVADHVHLGEGCTLGSKAGVPRDVPPGETWIGIPAQPAAEALKAVTAQKKLPEMRKTLRRLESQVSELQQQIEALSDGPREGAKPAA